MPIGLVAQERCFCNRCAQWKPDTDFSLVARAQHKLEDDLAMCLECVGKLFRGRLTRSEIRAYIKEDREKLLQRTRNPEFEEMTGERRLGKVMHSNELITRLKRVVPNLTVAPGAIEGDISLYRAFGDELAFIAYTNSGWLPEFSIVEFNADRQPIHERRGWRTVLLRIIKCGLLSEQKAEEVFGRPTYPQEARFWDRQLWWLRHDRTTVKD